jgi:thiol-disulfide isomerase/thioredoxin
MDVLTRSAIALGLILGGFSLYLFYNWTLKLRTRSLLADLGPLPARAFTLVYFSTHTCAPCKTIQRPDIQKLAELMEGSLHVVEIDATEKPEIARRWGVMSVPTTFLIDPRGRLRYVNHGVARTEKLLIQLHAAEQPHSKDPLSLSS